MRMNELISACALSDHDFIYVQANLRLLANTSRYTVIILDAAATCTQTAL